MRNREISDWLWDSVKRLRSTTPLGDENSSWSRVKGRESVGKRHVTTSRHLQGRLPDTASNNWKWKLTRISDPVGSMAWTSTESSKWRNPRHYDVINQFILIKVLVLRNYHQITAEDARLVSMKFYNFPNMSKLTLFEPSCNTWATINSELSTLHYR